MCKILAFTNNHPQVWRLSFLFPHGITEQFVVEGTLKSIPSLPVPWVGTPSTVQVAPRTLSFRIAKDVSKLLAFPLLLKWFLARIGSRLFNFVKCLLWKWHITTSWPAGFSLGRYQSNLDHGTGLNCWFLVSDVWRIISMWFFHTTLVLL